MGVTVNYTKCRNSVSAALIVIKKKLVTKVLINPITRTRTRHFRHAYHPTVAILLKQVDGTSNYHRDFNG
jgi:hypothetical protein